MRALVLILLSLVLSFNSQAANKKRMVSANTSNYQRAATEPTVYALWDVDDNRLIQSKNLSQIHPMASITKLMTVYVTLESGASMEEKLVVSGTDETSNKIRKGMVMSRRELIELALVSSDNLAARTLANSYFYGYQEFVRVMNLHAKSLGMYNTSYEDATGLLPTNVSTPSDIMLLTLAVSKYNIVNQAAKTTVVDVHPVSKNKTLKVQGRNTNPFVGRLSIDAAKTGFTNAAGRCLTMLFNANGHRYALVVLGAINSEQRQQMVNKLLDKTKQDRILMSYLDTDKK